MSRPASLLQPRPLPVVDESLAQRLRDADGRVEDELAGHVPEPDAVRHQAASHLLAAGGKRFRPLLVLLAAETGDRRRTPSERPHRGLRRRADPPRPRSTTTTSWTRPPCAAAPTRRTPAGTTTSRSSPATSCSPKSSELTAELGPDAVRIQAQTFTRLVEGQILETVPPGPGEDPLEHYLEVVAGKTGSLIATSARYGALFGGAPPEVVDALHGVRRDRRLGVPALRRHPRHRLRVRRVRQDARHRPARGRADAARC